MEKIHLTKNGLKGILSIILISFLLISFVSAIDLKHIYNPFTRQLDIYSGPNLTGENLTADYFIGDGSQLENVSANSSNYWDGLDTFNSTQMENNGGILNILEGWLNGLFCKLTGCSMTGNLITTGNITADTYFGDGSQLTGISGGEDVYVNESGDTMTGDLKLQDNVNISDTANEVRIYFEGGTIFIEG